MFGPDGRLYGCQNGRQRIAAWTPEGEESVIAEGVRSNDICLNAKGAIWFTDPPNRRVWHIPPGGKPQVVHEGLRFPNGLVLSADQSLLLVADMNTRTVWSFQVNPDGLLSNAQPFYRLELPDERDIGGADGMTVDTEGHLYVATDYGIQVCDQPGRVVAVLNKPHLGPLSNVVFGGAGLQWLYATAGDKVFRRRMRRKGVTPWTPVKPPQPRL
jgi:sugar lactone lactonase YvrE